MYMIKCTFSNSCSQSRLTMIYMTNSSYVTMWFITTVCLFLCIESLTSKRWQEQLTIQSMMMLLIRRNLQ